MSSLITGEMHFLMESILLGMGLAVGYEVLRLFRTCIFHGQVWTGVEDIFFWILTALILFSMILNENDGKIRWYALAGSGAGACLYCFYIHPVVVWILHPLGVPLRIVGQFIKKLLKKIANFVTLKVKRQIQKPRSRWQARKEAFYDRLRQKKEKEKKPSGNAGHHRRGAGAGRGAGVSDHAAQRKK